MSMRCRNVLLACLLLWAWPLRADARDEDRFLVCYYANWAVYRPGLAKFTPENIDPFLCTHLIYAFAGMNKDYELKAFDSYNDLQLGNYKKFTNLKSYNPKLKVMIAVGGWNEGSKRFSKMVESSSGRGRFVRGALSFLRKHGFDGLDLDWEYPGSRDGGRDSDKQGYARLVQELRSAFDSESVPPGKSRLLLTMAVPAGKQYIDKGYDVPTLSRHLDFLNLLTYDYHTAHEAQVNHHAPLGEEPGLEEWNPNKQLNVEWTVRYYLELGCDPSKLVLGVPTYGRSFTLADPQETDLGAPAQGPGEKGEATREGGYLAYYEICKMIQEEDWEMEAPHPDLMGPYAYKDNQWVGFDDEDIVLEKVKFIVRQGLGGAMVWTLDNDDFRGKCYGERSPLVSTLSSALRKGRSILLEQSPLTTSPMPQKKVTTPREKSTTPPFTTPDPGPPFACEDEGFFNHPTDCHKYFWCLDSGPSDLGLVAHAFTCPSGLQFNKARDSCDYATNVVCKVKKGKTTPTTTVRPRPRPRPRKTTTTTTTTTTTHAPSQRGESGKEGALTVDGQSLAELLQLLQKQLGVNQIHDRLHGRESGESHAALRPTPQYAAPPERRQRTTEEPSSDLFVQYARPARKRRPEEEETPVQPRGPQYQVPPGEHSEEEGAESPPATDSRFPFVYHTPSRTRATATPEEEEEEPDDVTTTTRKPRRVRVRPIPGESSRPASGSSYAPAQTVGVRQQVRPVIVVKEKEEEPEALTTPTPKRRARPRTTTTTRDPPRFRGPPPRRELIVLATGKPAVPATTRRYRAEGGVAEVTRGPGLALLPDGGVTCLRRGVHPHPKHCDKFIVCVPGEQELDGFIHECPGGTRFAEHRGRCTPQQTTDCSASS